MAADPLELLAAPMLDVSGVDLAGAARITYVLQQRFFYRYDGPVHSLDHRLVVLPRARHGNARCRVTRVEVSSPQVRTTARRDRAGNRVLRCTLAPVPGAVSFEVAAAVERTGPFSHARAGAAALRSPRLLHPTTLTAPDGEIVELARRLAAPDPLESAERFCTAAHGAITYDFGSTSVWTTAREALAGGRGVCQDHAHLMLALCRATGLPARYVSGHLLGEGGTHAWVEVVVRGCCPGAEACAVAFDPCNGKRADARYLTVAVGRDYRDVAPTSGTYEGSARGVLTATKRLGVTAVG